MLETNAPQAMAGLIEGRCVHYVAFNSRHLAAIVIGYEPDKEPDAADLAVFTNMLNYNGVKNFGLQFHQSVPYSEIKGPGTWHWIERAMLDKQQKDGETK